jgi:hypothetical protein
VVHFASLFLIFDNFYELKVLGSNGNITRSVGETAFYSTAFCHLESIVNIKTWPAGPAF